MQPTIQIGTIGAMQRVDPALTSLWLRWTGVPNLDRAEFNIQRSEVNGNPCTSVKLMACDGIAESWRLFCNTLGMPDTAVERRSMPIYIAPNSTAHSMFWGAMKKREIAEVDGPVEWWWRLLVMRSKGIARASRTLLQALGDLDALDGGIVGFVNPSLVAQKLPLDSIITDRYDQPTHVRVSFRVPRSSKVDAVDLGLVGDFRARFISTMIDLSVTASS